MAPAPLVSVVMSVRNGEKFLAAAVESILGQTFRDFELIIVDDASADATPGMLASFAARDARVRVLRQEKPTYVAGLIRGCAAVRGRYIARMDADDVAFPDRLERQVAALEPRPELAVIGGQTILIDEAGRAFGAKGYPVESARIKDMLLRKNCMGHPTTTIRKDAFAAVGGYREVFAASQDYDLWLRLAERYELANLPQPVLYRRFHASQVGEARLAKQVLCSLAACAAAEARRETGRDPLDGVTEITPEVLAGMGVGPEAVQDRMLRQLLGRARDNLRAGYAAAALANADAALECARAAPGSRRGLAKAHNVRAKVHLSQGRFLKSLAAAAKAGMLYLSLAGRRLARPGIRTPASRRGR